MDFSEMCDSKVLYKIFYIYELRAFDLWGSLTLKFLCFIFVWMTYY